MNKITRVELRLTNFCNTLRGTTFCKWRHIICCRSFINVILFDHCQCLSLYNRHITPFFFLEMWTVQLLEILKICPWKWEYDSEFVIHKTCMDEWTLSISFVYVAYNDVFSTHSNDMMSRQSSSAEKILCNVMPFFYHHRHASFFNLKKNRT